MTNPLGALTEAVEKMEPGPWWYDDGEALICDSPNRGDVYATMEPPHELDEPDDEPNRHTNGRGIVALRNAWPYLKAAAALAEAELVFQDHASTDMPDGVECWWMKWREKNERCKGLRAAFRAERDKLREKA